jgi:hypothetical protein
VTSRLGTGKTANLFYSVMFLGEAARVKVWHGSGDRELRVERRLHSWL